MRSKSIIGFSAFLLTSNSFLLFSCLPKTNDNLSFSLYHQLIFTLADDDQLTDLAHLYQKKKVL